MGAGSARPSYLALSALYENNFSTSWQDARFALCQMLSLQFVAILLFALCQVFLFKSRNYPLFRSSRNYHFSQYFQEPHFE
jgi:hypothetical protein